MDQILHSGSISLNVAKAISNIDATIGTVAQI
jgi:hypothetical protein